MVESTLLIVFLVCLIASSGYFSSSEAALFSLSPLQIKAFGTDPNPRWRLISQLLRHPRDLLVTIFMLNTLVNILLQNVVSHMVGDYAGWGKKVGIPLVITLIFGEIVPKYIGLQNNVSFSFFVAPVINSIQKFIEPIRKAIIVVTAPVSKLMFFYLRKEPSISAEELQHVFKTSKEHGILESEELELVSGYLQLQVALVKELLWPREDILFYDIDEPLSKLIYLFVDQQCSRLPVCKHSIDNVIGIINAKDFFLNRDTLVDGKDVLPLLSKPFYIPESASARVLLRRFYQKQELIALAVDEYGSIAGLITKEDLMEVVVGEISDLRDQKSLYTHAGKNEIIASGKMELAELNDIFGSHLASPGNMVTIGGYLTEFLGEIPKPGRKIETEEFLFHILSATPSRIRRIYIRRLLVPKSNHLLR